MKPITAAGLYFATAVTTARAPPKKTIFSEAQNIAIHRTVPLEWVHEEGCIRPLASRFSHRIQSMFRRIQTTAVVLLCIAVLTGCGPGGPLGSWGKLGDDKAIGPYRCRVPKGFKRDTLDRPVMPGETTLLFQLPRIGRPGPGFNFTYGPHHGNLTGENWELAIDSVVEAMRQQIQGLSHERGSPTAINGLPMVRIQFRGERPFKGKSYRMEGVVYVVVDSTNILAAMGMDFGSGASASISKLENALKTLRRPDYVMPPRNGSPARGSTSSNPGSLAGGFGGSPGTEYSPPGSVADEGYPGNSGSGTGYPGADFPGADFPGSNPGSGMGPGMGSVASEDGYPGGSGYPNDGSGSRLGPGSGYPDSGMSGYPGAGSGMTGPPSSGGSDSGYPGMGSGGMGSGMGAGGMGSGMGAGGYPGMGRSRGSRGPGSMGTGSGYPGMGSGMEAGTGTRIGMGAGPRGGMPIGSNRPGSRGMSGGNRRGTPPGASAGGGLDLEESKRNAEAATAAAKRADELAGIAADRGNAEYFSANLELLQIGSDAQKEGVLRRLSDAGPRDVHDEEVRRNLARALRNAAEDPKVGTNTRRKAIPVLVQWTENYSVPILIGLLLDEQRFIQMDALDQLAELKDERAITPVTELFVESATLRNSAADCLRVFGPAVEPKVLELVRPTEMMLARTMVQLLGDIGTQKSLATLSRLRKLPFYRLIKKDINEATKKIRERAKESE